MSSHVSLCDLVAPLSTTTFLEQHLIPCRPFLSTATTRLIDLVQSIPELQDVTQLVRRMDAVGLLGVNGFRSSVPGRVAMDFYHRGDTLYVHNLERIVSPAAAFGEVAVDLGVHPRYLGLELFMGRARAISTLHYDHDTNFQILLRGEKIWRIAPNRHIVNPLSSQHDLRTPKEESLAQRLPLPSGLDDLEELEELRASAGTCLFLPIGYWHEVVALDDCVALNIVVKPQRWCDAIAAAAEYAALRAPDLRAPAFGVLSDPGSPLAAHADRMLRAGLEAFARAVPQVQGEDVGLADEQTVFRWHDRAAGRRLDDAPAGVQLVCPELTTEPLAIDSDIGPLMRQLVRWRGSFGLQDLKRLAPEVPSGRLLQMMLTMTQQQYFQGA